MLLAVFVVRAVLTPFAHPLFTAWSGLAIGLAVMRKTPVGFHLGWGLTLAVLTHAGWNGALSISELGEDGRILLTTGLAFIGLFLLTGVALVILRRYERKTFLRWAPVLAERYGLNEAEVLVFGDWKTMLAKRKTLGPVNRRRFDHLHSALARLTLLHDGPGHPDPVKESMLLGQLKEARAE